MKVLTIQAIGIEPHMNEDIHAFIGMKGHGMASGENRFDFRVRRSDNMVARRLYSNALAKKSSSESIIVDLGKRNHLTRNRRE